MESFGHKMFISSQPVLLSGVLYPRRLYSNLRYFSSYNSGQTLVKLPYKYCTKTCFNILDDQGMYRFPNNTAVSAKKAKIL